MTWRVSLRDGNGRFWLVREIPGGRQWSEDEERAKVYSREGEAREAASKAQASADKAPDWFPKIKVVRFKTKE
jgi:hypothetical protein